MKAAGQQSALHRVHQSCRRCRACGHGAAAPRYYAPPRVYYAVPPPPVYYAAPRYEPSVVYYGPAGAYRPYPPVVVYDVPPRGGYSYSRWDEDDYRYHRRW
jgi:hypothetical protein